MSKRVTWTAVCLLCGLAWCLIVGLQTTYFLIWFPWAAAAVTGVQFGIFFGLILLAAAWTSLGSSPWRSRIWQSLLLGLLAVLAVLTNVLVGGWLWPGSRSLLAGSLLTTTGMYGIVALGQWLLVAVPLGLLRYQRKVCLRHTSDVPLSTFHADQQFGIREVIILTVLTAILLGAIRGLIQMKPWFPGYIDNLASLGYLALCHVFFALPLLVAPLLRRFALVATVAAMALTAVVTASELAVYIQFMPPVNTIQVEIWREVTWAANSSQAIVVVAVLGTLRAGGYRLAPQP
jgi:hypothetical protein